MIDNDLPELGPDIRELLDAERRAPAAPGASKARVLEGLTRAINAGPGGGGEGGASGDGSAPPPAQSPAPTLPTAGASAGVLAKLGLPGAMVLFVAGAVVGGVTWDAIRPTRVERVIVEVPVEVPVEVRVEVPAPAAKPTPDAVAEPETPVTKSPRPLKPKPQTPATGSAPESSDKDLEAERLLLTQARSALSKGLARAALEALDTHARRFGDGRLREERAALEVQALMLADRAKEAKKKAEAFHHDFPKSLLGAAVDAAIR